MSMHLLSRKGREKRGGDDCARGGSINENNPKKKRIGFHLVAGFGVLPGGGKMRGAKNRAQGWFHSFVLRLRRSREKKNYGGAFGDWPRL